MPHMNQIAYHHYTIYEVYEHGIELEIYPIGLESSPGKQAPIFVKKPVDRDSSDLIKALEQLEIASHLLKESFKGQRSLQVCAYIIYKIQGQEISGPVEDKVYVKLPPNSEFPIIVEIPKGLGDEKVKGALSLLKTGLLGTSK